jgi:methyl-accepting chemotaxis protein
LRSLATPSAGAIRPLVFTTGPGVNATTGDGNVYIGAGVEGVAGESDHTYICNIETTNVSGIGTDAVTANLSTGLLGHLTSSRRYKQEIQPMGAASETLYQLRPVTFRYKKEIDASQSLEYGLIAEDVAEVDPNLANRNRDGQIESVRYSSINAMLLNEFLKEHKKVEAQQANITQLNSEMANQTAIIAQQQKAMEALTAQLKEQAAQMQKVSAQLEATQPASQLVNNNP